MNIVFEQYFQEEAEKAIKLFRTFSKEDFMEEVMDTEYSLISEAFDDVNTLIRYSEVLNEHKTVSMEEYV